MLLTAMAATAMTIPTAGAPSFEGGDRQRLLRLSQVMDGVAAQGSRRFLRQPVAHFGSRQQQVSVTCGGRRRRQRAENR